MADSSSGFDCAPTRFLCTETEKSLCFDDLDGATGKIHQEKNGKDLSFGHGKPEALISFPCPSDDEFFLIFERETDHLPKDDYLMRLRSGDLELSVRREALDWIWKAHAHYGFRERCFVLSMNYLDRFLSAYELPRGKIWTTQLLAVACLSLAAKMEEIEVPLVVDLQVGEPKFVFEGKTIRRMELLVLSSLNWKMRPHTPCTFIDYFLGKIIDNRIQLGLLIPKAMQLITSTIRGIDFLQFRPSEIAAAVALSVTGEIGAVDIHKALSHFKQVEKGRVVKCLEMIHDLMTISVSTVTNMATSASSAPSSSSSVPQSPNGVLEAACLSCKTDDRTVGSCPNSSPNSPDTKRRKLDRISLEDLNKS